LKGERYEHKRNDKTAHRYGGQYGRASPLKITSKGACCYEKRGLETWAALSSLRKC